MLRPLSWLPLRYIIKRAAKSQGFLDPLEIMARLRGLAQPSEVGEPIELLRAGVVFHARGLINSKVIQHNLDWVWPYWVERQYDPRDIAFTPRAFSVTHINLTHRNWTALGFPDQEELAIVDPRGLLTPLMDSWSLDSWILSADGRQLLPSRLDRLTQSYETADGLKVVTEAVHEGLKLRAVAEVVYDDELGPVCELELSAADERGEPGRLAVSLRPYNPEGISFVNEIALGDQGQAWLINDRERVVFNRPADEFYFSDYEQGDVLFKLKQEGKGENKTENEVHCDVGLASAAAVFELGGEVGPLRLRVPLRRETIDSQPATVTNAWQTERSRACQLKCPEPAYQRLWDQALSSLVIHSPLDVYPGPYTYKRFWFRDAAFIIHALLATGLQDRARRAIDQFFHRQTALGYFRSQEGEWDSNGEVLWILHRYQQLTGLEIPAAWHKPIKKGARWIIRKLLDENLGAPHAGLLPAGFSAEHLGPNDYYYWDDFWSIAGLDSAADLLRKSDPDAANEFEAAARKLRHCVDRSLESCEQRLGSPAMPASPYRRLDAGAIGSVAAGYPLQLFPADDSRLLGCVDFLLDNCFIDDAFFQDMIHSGLNAYLTLEVAQVLLRADDPRYLQLMDRVVGLASPTGQWPEAIHPQTLGGCMGDGHHVWASAEWLLMVRNCFVSETEDRLILCSGIPERWLNTGVEIEFGPAATRFGTITLSLRVASEGQLSLKWTTQWHGEAPPIEIRLRNYSVLEQNRESALLLERDRTEAS